MKRTLLLSLTFTGISTLYANTFAIIGDFGGNNAGSIAVSKALHEKSPEFIITVGDNNYPRGCLSTIDTNIGQYYSDYIGSYQGSYGQGAKENLFFPTLGNHDWDAVRYCHNGETLPYQDYFPSLENKTYYDFIKNDIHFFALDSDPREPDGNHKGSKQYQWFKEKVSASKAKFKIAYFHHAPYSSSYHSNNKDLQWDFAQLGIDAVLAGHDHIYERIERNGILYFVNGIGGADSNYRVWFPVKGSKFIYNKKYGYMLATVTSNTLKFQLYSQDNELVDEAIIKKK